MCGIQRLRTSIWLLAALAMLVLAVLQAASASTLRVAVTPFEVADRELVEYADFARDELENTIIGLGSVEIVERQRMDAMANELAFGQFSGLGDASQASQFGKMVGASILVTGSLLKLNAEVKEFSGYGVRTRTTIVTATLRVRAYDIERGTIVYSDNVDGQTSVFETNSGGQYSADSASAAVSDALEQLSENERFRSVFARLSGAPGKAPEAVLVSFAPTPENCDVEINGVYQGSTPMELPMTAGSTMTVRLSKAGFRPWEKQVAVREGLRISPELEAEP